MAAQKVQHGRCEDVVAVAGDHVPGAADIGELDIREAGKKFLGSLLTDQVAHLPPE